MVIPELDDTTIRAISVAAASTLKNADVTEMLGKADVIQEYIDPQAYSNDFNFKLEKQP